MLESLTKKNHLLVILIIALVTRIYHIDAPILGIRGWRQADTMAMAINFYENGYNLFYPQIDWGGETSGYVESEFPVYSYLVALSFSVFGISEISARIISIIFSLISIVVFFFLVRELVGTAAAFWSCLFLGILPLNVFIGRMIMPESLLMMSLITGVFCFSRWLTTMDGRYYLFSVLSISLACLIKIPSLYIGLPLFYFAWLKYGKQVLAQWEIWIYASIVVGLTGAWYYHAHQIYLRSGLTFGIWEYGTDKWGNWELVSTLAFWKVIWFDHLGTMFFVGIGYPIFIAGLLLPRTSPKEYVFDFWLASVIIYFFIVGLGNYVHDYYQLPFTIPASVYLGKVYARYFSGRHSAISLGLSVALVGILSLGAYNYNRIYMNSENPKKSEIYELAQFVQKYTEQDSLIIAVDNEDPNLLYLSNRKGWHVSSGAELLDTQLLTERIGKGAKYLVGRLNSCYDDEQCVEFEALLDRYEIAFKNKDNFILRLSD